MGREACGQWAVVTALVVGCGQAPGEGDLLLENGSTPARAPSSRVVAEPSQREPPSPELDGGKPTVESTPAEAVQIEALPLLPEPLPPALSPTPRPAAKIEIELTQPVDDFVYASVDGLRRKVWYINEPGQLRRFDVTSWFGSGEHVLRLQAINTVGPTTFGARVWVDGALALDVQCPAELCNGGNAPGGIVLDRTLTLSTSGPPMTTVNVISATPGKLYVDDAFTGLTTSGTSVPVTLSLPPGEHTLGLGVSTDLPPYAGSFYEHSIAPGSEAVSVDFSAAAPLPVQELTRVALVPVRRFVVDTFVADEVGVLSDADVTELTILARATRDEWLEPFSYGLVSWQLTTLPVVEDVALHARTHEDAPDAEGFLSAAGLAQLREQYEIVLLYYDLFDADGSLLSGVVGGERVEVPGIALGGGGLIWFNTAFAGAYGDPTGPNPALLHEALHNYESYNELVRHLYLGADGLHGGEEHGYYSGDGGELDFALWQRLYMRNQIAELGSTRVEQPVLAPAAKADLWVGAFDTLRRGYTAPF